MKIYEIQMDQPMSIDFKCILYNINPNRVVIVG